jgi:hypothetical protein
MDSTTAGVTNDAKPNGTPDATLGATPDGAPAAPPDARAAADPAPDPGSPLERAIAQLEGEIDVVFPNVSHVARACAQVREAVGDRADCSTAAALARVVPIVFRRTGAFQAPVLELLADAARAALEPWPLIQALLASPNERVCADALDVAAGRVQAGTLTLGPDRIRALAELGEREGSPLFSDACLTRIAEVVRRVGTVAQAPGGPAPPDVGVDALLLDPDHAAVRRLGARLLDLAGALPGEAVVRGILDAAGAEVLGPAIAYTRARHIDLVDLVRRPGAVSPLATSFPPAVESCGQLAAHDLVGELGWARVNLGIHVRPHVGVSVDDSMPFVVSPPEAALICACGGAKRVFQHVLAVGHGGSVEDAGSRTGDPAIGRFRAYNLAHAGVLGDLLDVAPLTAERVETALGKMDHLTSEFVALFTGRSDECELLPRLYGALKERIRQEVATTPPGRTLSVEATRLVQMFEDPPSLADVQTLHGLKRYLHQKGLALGFGLLKASQGTNRTVDLALVSDGRVGRVVRKIEYVDVEPEDGPGQDVPPLPYAVAVVADAYGRHLLRGRETVPRTRIFCYGNEVHYYVAFRNHPVFVRIDYSPPLSGGMIDLAYYGVSKYELDAHPNVGLDAIQTLLRRLDFQVEVDNTRIHARYDKERALDLADLCAKAEALLRLAPYLMDADWLIGGLDLPPAGRQAVAVAWADFFDRWGTLPDLEVLTADRRGIVAAREQRPEGTVESRWTGEGPYTDLLSGRPRPSWLPEVHAAASAAGLDVPQVAHERAAGQLLLESQVLGPLRAAVARGALVAGSDGFERASPDCYQSLHEVDAFASLLASSDEQVAGAARLARLATALERTLRFETTGTVNGHEVQRAELGLRHGRGALYALRDATGIFRLGLFARDGALYRHRVDPAHAWSTSASSDAAALAALLRRNNFLPSWIDSSSHPEDEARAVRAAFATHGGCEFAGLLPGERIVAGLKASPGRRVGPARLGTKGRIPADLDGGVLIATTLTPEDAVFLPHAVAVVGTGGGILSHAGLMAVQFGRPAIVIPGEWRTESGGATYLACRCVEFETLSRTVAGIEVVERRNVREHETRLGEGDLVIVDADAGTLGILGQGQTALAVYDTMRTFVTASRRIVEARTPEDVLAQRGHRLRALHQLERLFGRVSEPAMVRLAVRELLWRERILGPEGERDAGRLLRLLFDRPAIGAIAAQCARQYAHEVVDRCRAACEQARHALPLAATAYDVLALRKSVAVPHATLRHLPTLGMAAADEGLLTECLAVESLAHARLSVFRDRALTALRAVAGEEGDATGLRHQLRQACHLVAAVGASDAERDELAIRERQLAERDRAAVAGLASRVVVWPGDGGYEIVALAGTKAANLAELHRLGFGTLVPGWFAVTERAFRDALAMPPPARPTGPWSPARAPRSLGEAIDAVVSRADADPPQKAALIRQLWEDVRLPQALCEQVTAAYAELARGAGQPTREQLESRGLGSRILGRDRREDPTERSSAEHTANGDAAPYVAIRSSAREEDTEDTVAAGQFDTFLFVRGAADVLRFLRRAWSGLWTARAIHDRLASKRPPGAAGGGALVQRIAWSRVSGVLQTIDVAAGRTREMVVNAGLGLGEGIVSGAVAADHVVVSKDDDPFTQPIRFHYVTADKRERVIFDVRRGTGTVRADVLAHQRLRAALEYAELVELVQVATRLEQAYGHPLDVEFGFEDAALRILQVRPVPGLPAMWRDFREQGTA